jgi:hypothetical protein
MLLLLLLHLLLVVVVVVVLLLVPSLCPSSVLIALTHSLPVAHARAPRLRLAQDSHRQQSQH